MTIINTSLDPSKLTLQWREEYYSIGSNKKASPIPKGIYKGFFPCPNDISPNGTIYFKATNFTGQPFSVPEETSHVAVIEDPDNGVVFTFRDFSDPIAEVDVSSFLPSTPGKTWIAWLELTYAGTDVTTARIVVSDDPAGDFPTPGTDAFVTIMPMRFAGVSATFDPASDNPALLWNPDDVAMYFGVNAANRETPAAFPVDDLTTGWQPGDKTWGQVNGVERWSIPTVDQKKAMNAASSPSATNPFITSLDPSFYGTLTISHTSNPEIILDRTGGVANQHKWSILNDLSIFKIAALSDLGVGNIAFMIDRVGSTPSMATLYTPLLISRSSNPYLWFKSSSSGADLKDWVMEVSSDIFYFSTMSDLLVKSNIFSVTRSLGVPVNMYMHIHLVPNASGTLLVGGPSNYWLSAYADQVHTDDLYGGRNHSGWINCPTLAPRLGSGADLGSNPQPWGDVWCDHVRSLTSVQVALGYGQGHTSWMSYTGIIALCNSGACSVVGRTGSPHIEGNSAGWIKMFLEGTPLWFPVWTEL